MSEYWVSQAKYYCKVCNCYIADNKPSRQHHDNGVKHKEKVELLQKQKRLDKLQGARSESELKHQLAEIEKAAKEAIAVDRTEQDGYFYQNSGARPRVPPPPPAPRPPGFPRPNQAEDDEDQEGLLEEDDGTGMYTVKGQTYLQGKIHEEKIRTGMECEIFVEAQDEWYRGVIDARHDTPIPHTELFLVSFDVSFTIKNPDTGEDEVTKEKEIKSDRIRLLADADGTLPGFIAPDAAPLHVVNEHTGMGMWQTVAVREVDEEAELAESERARELMFRGGVEESTGKNANKNKKQPLQEGEEGFEDHTDSAMSAYDPYGRQRGIYRGIKLQEDANFKEQIESVAEGATIGFKKRKTAEKVEKTVDGQPVPSSASNTDNSNGNGPSKGSAYIKTEPVTAPIAVSTISTTGQAITEAPATTLTTTSTTTSTITTAAVVPAPFVMKIGNMSGGGAKRKFRVREPSP